MEVDAGDLRIDKTQKEEKKKKKKEKKKKKQRLQRGVVRCHDQNQFMFSRQ